MSQSTVRPRPGGPSSGRAFTKPPRTLGREDPLHVVAAPRSSMCSQLRQVLRAAGQCMSLLVAFAMSVNCGSKQVPGAHEPFAAVSARSPSKSVPVRAPIALSEQGFSAAPGGILPIGVADNLLPIGRAPIVRLIHAGREPLGDLRYVLREGVTQRVVLASEATTVIRTKGEVFPPTRIPRTTIAWDMATAERSTLEEYRIELRLITAGIETRGAQEDEMARAMAPELTGMKGLTISYWASSKGLTRDIKVNLPLTTSVRAERRLAGMAQAFDFMVTPLPQEPVGIGATWQVLRRVSSRGMDLLQTSLFTLTSRTTDGAVLSVRVNQVAASNTVHAPEMPPNMVATLKNLSSVGVGTTQLKLTSVAPESGTMMLTTAMLLSSPSPSTGISDESVLETTTTVRIGRP